MISTIEIAEISTKPSSVHYKSLKQQSEIRMLLRFLFNISSLAVTLLIYCDLERKRDEFFIEHITM